MAPITYKSPDCGNTRKYVFRPLSGKTFKFQVKAKSDVSLCLSPSPSEVPYQQYEIFIGGWGGSESAIRRNKNDEVKKVSTPNILDKNQFKGFWVVITDHFIKVGREGQSIPFLTHSDASVKINVSYYGYCTAWGATGQWTFADDNQGQGIDMTSVGAAISQIHIKPVSTGMYPTVPQPSYPQPSVPQPYHPSHYPTPTAPMKAGINLQWILCKSASMCPAPVLAAPGANGPYVAIAYHQKELLPGVVMPPDINACHVPWGGKTFTKMDFYVLSNPGNVDLVWQPGTNGSIPTGAVQGGYVQNGEPLYIGRFLNNGSYVNGKVHPSHNCCYAPVWGKEVSSTSYEVLCLKTVPLHFFGL